MALASKESASPPVPTHAKIGTIARIEALDFTDARGVRSPRPGAGCAWVRVEDPRPRGEKRGDKGATALRYYYVGVGDIRYATVYKSP